MTAQELPDRPSISTPERLRGRALVEAERRRLARQPGLGLAGLTLVVPVAVLLAIGAGGAEPSVLVLAPLVTFSLPVVAMIAFWWEDWPGTRLRSSWSGWADTLLVMVAAVLLTMAGQAVAGELDLHGIFDPTPGPGHAATVPATLPLAGAAFVAMLQLTLVCEGWPLRGLGNQTVAGLGALAVSWAVALAVYFLLVDVEPPIGSGLSERSGPVTGAQLGAFLTLLGAWQVLLFVAWRGWPVSGISRRAVRLVAANAAVLGGAGLTYAAAYGLGDAELGAISAVAGAFVAAGLLVGMLFEGALHDRMSAAAERAAVLAAIALGAAALYLLLRAYADGLTWTRAEPEDWIGHAGLNAIGVAVILHVAIGRRWPFGDGESP